MLVQRPSYNLVDRIVASDVLARCDQLAFQIEYRAGVKAAGGKGYVVKSHAARDLAKAIQTIIDGGDYFSDGLQTKPEKPEKQKKKFPLLCLDRVPAFA